MIFNERHGAVFAVLAVGIGLTLVVPATSAADLYLLSCVHLEPKVAYSGSVDIALYHLVEHRLIEVVASSAAPKWADVVVVDNEAQIAFISHLVAKPTPFTLFFLTAPHVFNGFNLDVPGWSTVAAHITGVVGQPRSIVVKLVDFAAITRGASNPEVVKVYNIDRRIWTDASYENYRDLRVVGGAEGNRWTGRSLIGLRSTENGELLIKVPGRQIAIGAALPPDLRFSPRDGPVVLLSNSHLLAVTDVTLAPTKRSLRIRMLDRRDNTWRPLDVPGNASWIVRAFGPWIAGIVDETARGKTFRLSPGRQRADPAASIDTIDNYLEIAGIYRSGRLFLYNIETRQYYEWDTHEGDCEVLLVENGEVYYRVDREIFRAPIESKTLGSAVLVVEGANVPDIHWAFFGPSTTPPAAKKQP